MKTILLIEDSDDIRETTAEIMELAGYEVVTAANGKIGVELAKQNPPDLVICDIMMPILDGYGVLHIFSQTPHLQGIPFIFLTAKVERSDFRKGMEMGADDYLTKPFGEVELLNAIETRLRKKQVSQNAYETYINLQNKTEKSPNLTIVASQRKVMMFKKKQFIYVEGNEPTKFYLLKSGKIKTFQTNTNGKEFITGLYHEGDFFGYVSIIQGSEYQETAECLDDCEIFSIPKEEFTHLIFNNQAIANEFVALLANYVQEKETQLTQMAYNSIRKRTADALLKLKQTYPKDSTEPFSIRISRDNLASMVGTATESLIRALSDFKSEKTIDITHGEITILNPSKLANLRD